MKSLEAIRLWKQKRSKRTLEWYYRMKQDPVKWEEFKQKRRVREKARYDEMNQTPE